MMGAGAGFVLALLADWSRVGGLIGFDRVDGVDGVDGVEGRELVKVLSRVAVGRRFFGIER